MNGGIWLLKVPHIETKELTRSQKNSKGAALQQRRLKCSRHMQCAQRVHTHSKSGSAQLTPASAPWCRPCARCGSPR